METLELMKQRHSVRQYKDLAIDSKQRAVLNELIEEINNEAGLHIQIFYDEPQCFDSMMAHYGKFTGVKNYIALVGKKSPKLDETLGYYGEKIVLKMQGLGLNSCWVAMTHGKSKADICKGEKQICLIAFGYGETQGVPHKNKSLQAVCNHTTNTILKSVPAENYHYNHLKLLFGWLHLYVPNRIENHNGGFEILDFRAADFLF